jgi:hypothetical protein
MAQDNLEKSYKVQINCCMEFNLKASGTSSAEKRVEEIVSDNLCFFLEGEPIAQKEEITINHEVTLIADY